MLARNFDRATRLGQHRRMKNLRTMLLIGGAVGMGAFVVWPRGASADKPSACQQWEVMLTQPARVTIDAKSLPEAGKPVVEASPAGWEPFAFGPTGQLVHRRCAR